MSFSNFLEQAVLDHVFAGETYTPPTNIYVKLHTGDPGEDAANNAAGETTRIEATFADGTNPILNDAPIAWTDVSTAEEYTHGSLWDHETAGNPLGSGEIGTPASVTVGDNFTIPIGDLAVSLD